MLTKEQIENLTMLDLSFNLTALQLRTTAFSLYGLLEKAEAELAELRKIVESLGKLGGVMRRESLYCPCGQPIKVTCYSHLSFFRDMDGCGIDRCPSCNQILKYDNLVELGNLREKHANPNI